MKARTTILLVLLCLCIFMGQTAYADTDGTELQILEPSYLEIQLGIDWASAEDTSVSSGSVTVSVSSDRFERR